MNLREIIWPRLDEPAPVLAAQDAQQREADLDTIRAAKVKGDHIDALIEEARRLTNAEDARRTGTDARATSYLAIVGVLAPILATLAPAVVTGGFVKGLVTLALFGSGGAYVAWCGLWSFRVLRVSTGARVDAVELVELWCEGDPRIELAKRLLHCVRWSRDGVNFKVTCLKMAHEFAVRALAVFVLALVVRSAWDPILAILKALGLAH